jgi:aerobic-type carbon monoxide dehydrogenase small subunit (CoxS/CutS family)
MARNIEFTVNGRKVEVSTDPQRSLLEVLREDLGLTGTKLGCGQGECGACAVLIDGRRALACHTPVAAAQGKKITTIEGLSTAQGLHPVQEAFLAEHAMQCGFCTPGMVLSAVALLAENPNPTDDDIVQGMNGNLCRCNGYRNIRRAIRRAAKQTAEATR